MRIKATELSMNSCIQNSCVKPELENIKKYFCYKNYLQRYKTLVSEQWGPRRLLLTILVEEPRLELTEMMEREVTSTKNVHMWSREFSL